MRLDTALAFLRHFLPLAGTIVLASYFYAGSHRDSARSRIEAAEVVNVRLGAGMLDRRLLIVIRDLHIVAASSAVRDALQLFGLHALLDDGAAAATH